MDRQAAERRLDEIADAIAAGNYRKGMWQQFTHDVDDLDKVALRSLSDRISDVSRQLHRRNGFLELPFAVALVLELATLAISIFLLGHDSAVLRVAGIAALALSLQPSIKIVTGLLFGIRYDYAFLWYFEPRFKMRYGTYLEVGPAVRVAFHLAGSVGTPIAMLVGYFVMMPDEAILAYTCLVLFAGATLMQVGAFAAEWLGVRNVGGFRLSTLTSPATAAWELKRLRR